MKSINLTNFGILAGALAVGYILYKASQTSAAMQSLANPTQYGNQWDSWQPKTGTLYV